MMYAEYNGKRYRCTIPENDELIILSKEKEKGFRYYLSNYEKKVKRAECSCVYDVTTFFEYQGDEYRYEDIEDEYIYIELDYNDLPKFETYDRLGSENGVYFKKVKMSEGRFVKHYREY